jgi:hypothetical protein
MAGALAGALLSLVLVSPTVARAGVYRVYTCEAPGGRLLGPTIGGLGAVSGWRFDVVGQGVAFTISDYCPLNGSFAFGIPHGPIPAGGSVAARWTAPPDTGLDALDMHFSAYTSIRPEEGTMAVVLATDRAVMADRRSPVNVSWQAPEGNAHAAGLGARWFELRVECLDRCPAAGNGGEGLVQDAWFDVRDDLAPVGGLTGSAVDAQTWSGAVAFALSAADQGGGLRRAVIEVDGSDAVAVPLTSQSNCADFDPSTVLAEYTAAQPCPLRIENGSLDVDAAKLPQGQHVVRILLEDAAGNRTTVFGPLTRNITSGAAIGPGSDVALRGAANGDGASDLARLSAHWGRRGGRTLLVSPFGRTHVVRGRLRTADGAPIANAAIDVVSKTTAVNARELGKRVGPRTGSDGSWYVVLPRRVSSRDVTFRYRSHVNDTIASATARVRLRVRAGLRLAIHPRRARQGQAIRFSGRLLGDPLPRGGKQVVLMARASRGAWVRFNVVRTDGRGRFRAVYRFQQPGAALYRFRALSLSEAAYPYLAGGSNIVRVRKD